MENLSSDIISILQYLLPGFVAAWIFYSLTSYPKPSQFERVIQALIFTLIVQATVSVIIFIINYVGTFWDDRTTPESFNFVCSVFVAVAFGFAFSYFANNDKLHKYFRDKKITRETSFPSEWFGAFLKDVTFVVLHFHDERRLYGWPVEWPSEPTKGHFVLADPSWVGENGEDVRILGVKNILVNVNDVKWVEFMEKTWEKADV